MRGEAEVRRDDRLGAPQENRDTESRSSKDFGALIEKVGGKGREGEAGRVGTQYVPEVLPKAVAARKILFGADTSPVPPMGSLLFLPPETLGRNSQDP